MSKTQINKQLKTWQITFMVMWHCFAKSSKGADSPTTGDLCCQWRNAQDVLGYWQYVATKPGCRRLGQENLATVSADLKNDYSEIRRFTVRNMQYMVQFFNEYNQELTMNFTLPIKHLDWTHNLVLIKQVKDIHARYWYMVQNITNHWTTRYLQEAIKLDNYGKHGALANNFTETLPIPETNDVKSMVRW